MSFEFEKKKLKSYLGKFVYRDLKESNAILAGGAITSLFTRSTINDLDLYFRSNEELYNFVENNIGHVVSHTKKATQWLHRENGVDKLFQVITFEYFESPKDVFEKFDFTVCMGAFDFKTEEFVFHEDFLKHNAQKLIKFNHKTSYPIISALRLQKYKEKGYYISKSEFMRVILSCVNLEINTYEELKEHLGGMYGESYDRLFEDVEGEFSLAHALELMENLSVDDSYFAEYKHVDYDINEILMDLDKSEKELYQFKGGVYRRMGNKFKQYNSSNLDGLIDASESEDAITVYKVVSKKEGVHRSVYNNSFIYTLNTEVKAEKDYIRFNYGNDGKLFFNYKNTLTRSPYYHRLNGDDCVVIEVSVKLKDIISASSDEVTATTCLPVREVPLDELHITKNPLGATQLMF